MNRSHKIRLNPNNKQITYFKKACGCSRLAYNWGLSEWKRQYEASEKPSAYIVKKKFNSIKRDEFPFVYEVTKTACESAFSNLDKAFKGFFRRVKSKKNPGYPKFKKKGIHDSFTIDNTKFSILGDKIKIPKLGLVRMSEELRFSGKLLSATVSRTSDIWFVSISVETSNENDDNQAFSPVGIDLGISKLATLSDGTVFDNIRTTKLYEGRLRRINRSLSRKKIGSNNRSKAKIKLSKLYYKIKCVRLDNIHKMTKTISDNFTHIYLEDLNVSGMIKNRKLSKAISDASFYEIRRQLEYKSKNVNVVNRFFPSTKLCMDCGTIHEMPLSKRVFKCDCNGVEIDRDVHAAQNILRQGLSEVKPVEMEALAVSNNSETIVCETGNSFKGFKGNLSNFL